MADHFQEILYDDVGDNTVGPGVDIRNITAYSVFVAVTGGTSIAVNFEGTTDPAGVDGWADLAFRQAGGGTYAITPVVVAAAGELSVYFDPSDNVNWIRLEMSSETGVVTNVYAVVTGEA